MKALALAAAFLIQGIVPLPSQNGVVTGQLRLRDGAPAAGVRIVAQAVAAPGEPSIDGSAFASLAQTDAEGRYRLEGLPPGRFHIAAGFVNSLTYFPGVTTPAQARVVTITAGSSVEGIDFRLALSAGVRVSGYLRGFPEGRGLGVPRVNLQPMDLTPGVMRVYLDAAVQPGGSFEFTRVPPGFYNLRTPYTSTATPVQVGESDVSGVEIKLAPAVMGRVRLDDGGSLPRQLASIANGVSDAPALVGLQFRKTSPVTSMTSPVMGNGVFAAFLTPGEYQVALPLAPLGYSMKSMTYGSLNLLQSVLTVSEQTRDEIEVTLTRTAETGVRVSGRVTGITGNTTPNQAWVTLQTNTYNSLQPNIPEQRVRESFLQTDGGFVLEDIPPNFYNLRVFPLGITQTITVPSGGVSDIEIAASAASRYTALPATVSWIPLPTAGPPPPAGTATISGRVVTIPGTTMPPAIRLRSYSLGHPPSGGFETAVNADGTFQFKGLPAGEFDLNVMGVPIQAGRNFTTTGQDIAGIEVNVPVAVRGRVVMTDGTPPPPSSMAIENAYPPGATGGARAAPMTQRYFEVLSDGTFSVNVVQGEQRISMVNLPPGFSVRSMTYGSVDLMANPLRVAVPFSEIVVTLQRTPQQDFDRLR